MERLRAEKDFLSFCKFVDPKHPVEARHIKLMCEKLEEVAKFILTDGKEGIGRLMIFMPPRYWKSQTASRKFPAWLLGKNPDLPIILTSYGADLASKHSKAVRDLIMTDRYQSVFGSLASMEEPVELDPESKSSAAWDIAGHMGGMIAAGVGGAITGFGAKLFIFDDPVKGRKEAQSESVRKDNFEWYKGTAYTRLEDHAAIIGIMTRWDIEDLAGQLLRAMVSDEESDQWEVLFMPALALEEEQYPKTSEEFIENLLRGIYIPMNGDQLGRKTGEPLWPEKQNKMQLKIKAANMEDFEFAAQFQQMPRLADGNFFDDKDFGIIEKAPEGLRWFRYVDLAIGKNKENDFNCTYAIAFAENGDLIIRDPYKEQNLDVFLPQCKVLMLSEAETGTIWGIEDVAFQVLVVKEMLKDRRLVNIAIRSVIPLGSKEDRAYAWRLRAKQGKVKLVRGTWNIDCIRVAAAFPLGRHDDDIDSISGGVQMIAEEEGSEGKTVSSTPVIVEAEALFEIASVGGS